jgi:hypothetical protein
MPSHSATRCSRGVGVPRSFCSIGGVISSSPEEIVEVFRLDERVAADRDERQFGRFGPMAVGNSASSAVRLALYAFWPPKLSILTSVAGRRAHAKRQQEEQMGNEVDPRLAELEEIAAELDAMEPGTGTAALTSGLELARIHLDSKLSYLKLEREIKESSSHTQRSGRTLAELAAEIDAIEPGTGTAAFAHGVNIICEQLTLALSQLEFKQEVKKLNEQTREIQRMMQEWR